MMLMEVKLCFKCAFDLIVVCLIVEELWEREGKLGFWSEIGVILGAARLSGVKLGLFWSEIFS